MEIKLDAEAVAGIASAAIFDSMSEEARDSVIQQAIQYLLTPDQDRASRMRPATTPLQDAFNDAIRQVAYKVVKEKIENDPEIQEAILTLLGPLLTAALTGEASEYGTSLSDKLGIALGSWLNDMARERGSR